MRFKLVLFKAGKDNFRFFFQVFPDFLLAEKSHQPGLPQKEMPTKWFNIRFASMNSRCLQLALVSLCYCKAQYHLIFFWLRRLFILRNHITFFGKLCVRTKSIVPLEKIKQVHLVLVTQPQQKNWRSKNLSLSKTIPLKKK